MEFKEPSLISFAKLLQSEIEDFGNINSLPADAKLFLTKAKEWIEESSEIEVLPPPVSGYAILFRRAKHLFVSQMKFSRFRVDFCKESNLKFQNIENIAYLLQGVKPEIKTLKLFSKESNKIKIFKLFCKESNLKILKI